MIIYVALLVVIVLAAAVAIAILRSRRPHEVQRPEAVKPAGPDLEAERQEAQEVGWQLLSRRVELDARRGALGGDTSIDSEFDRLQERLRAGEISEDHFEQEKIRLLGG